MKYIYYIKLLLVVSNLVIMSSCDESLPNESDELLLSRSGIISDSQGKYYYYHGEKTYVDLDPAKEYVIMRDLTVASRASVPGLPEDDPFDYYGQIIDKSASAINSTSSTSDNSEIIAVEDVTADGSPLSPHVYVKLKTSCDIGLLNRLASEIGWRVTDYKTWHDNLRILTPVPGSELRSLDAARYLYENGDFEYVDPGFNVDIKLSYRPREPFIAEQWSLYPDNGINVFPVWDTTLGSSDITLAIIDSGVDKNNPDFSSHLHYYSYNPITKLSQASQSNAYHATGVASIAAASHNSWGIAGVAPNTTIMDIGVHKTYSTDNYTNITILWNELCNGVTNAANNGAHVLNCSWGSKHSSARLQAIEDCLNSALTTGRNGKGCVIVFSAGNSGSDGVDYPAYLFDNVIRVGSTYRNGVVSNFSARGPEVDVMAPGENVLIDSLANSVVYDDGTSFAAPHVSGLACLILSERPDLTAAQVKQLIVETAGRSTHSNDYGWGLINAEYAINALRHTSFAFTPSLTQIRYTQNNQYTFTLTGVPRSATVTWRASVGRLKYQNNNSVTYSYPTVGSYNEHVSATITYMGRTSTITLDCVVEVPGEIAGIEIDDVNHFDRGEIYLYAVCSQLHPELEWEILSSSGSGSFQLIDFPLSSDASYIDTGDQYICLKYSGIDMDDHEVRGYPYPQCKVRVYWEKFALESTCIVYWDGFTWNVKDGSPSGFATDSTDPDEETQGNGQQTEI